MPANVVKYGSYTFPITPQIKINRELRRDDENDRTSVVEVWELKGWLKSGTSLGCKALLEAMLSGLSTDLKTLRFETSGGTLLRELTPAATYRGPIVKKVDAPSDGSDASFATNIPFAVEIEGEKIITGKGGDSDVWFENQTISFSTDRDKLTTKTIKGRIKVKEGVDVKTKVLSRDPGFSLPPGESAPFGANIRTTYDITDVSEDLTECQYTFVHQELFEKLPTGVTSGQFSTTTGTDSQGRNTITISGEWVGSGAKSAAEALEPPPPLISRSLVENEHRGSWNFSYVYEVHPLGDVLEFEESVSIRRSFVRKRFFGRRSATARPYRQDIEITPAFVTQSGSALGKTGYPTLPTPLYPEDDFFEAPSIARGPVQRGVDGSANRFPISWTYVFAFADVPEELDPNITPPDA